MTDQSFAALKAGFARATQADPAGLTELSFLLAGRPVRVRVAGDGLAERIARPLAHLAAPTPPGLGLRIDLWDAEETGMPSPLRPASEEAVTSSSDGRFLASGDQAAPWRSTGPTSTSSASCSPVRGWRLTNERGR